MCEYVYSTGYECVFPASMSIEGKKFCRIHGTSYYHRKEDEAKRLEHDKKLVADKQKEIDELKEFIEHLKYVPPIGYEQAKTDFYMTLVETMKIKH